MREAMRYVVNGVIATLVHFSVLVFNIDVLGFQSAAAANFIAAIIGIGTSFLGSRYFVFQAHKQPAFSQLMKFLSLYGFIALLHASLMMVWADILLFDYKAGFVFITVIQVLCSYIGNKYLVFIK